MDSFFPWNDFFLWTDFFYGLIFSMNWFFLWTDFFCEQIFSMNWFFLWTDFFSGLIFSLDWFFCIDSFFPWNNFFCSQIFSLDWFFLWTPFCFLPLRLFRWIFNVKSRWSSSICPPKYLTRVGRWFSFDSPGHEGTVRDAVVFNVRLLFHHRCYQWDDEARTRSHHILTIFWRRKRKTTRSISLHPMCFSSFQLRCFSSFQLMCFPRSTSGVFPRFTSGVFPRANTRPQRARRKNFIPELSTLRHLKRPTHASKMASSTISHTAGS